MFGGEKVRVLPSAACFKSITPSTSLVLLATESQKNNQSEPCLSAHFTDEQFTHYPEILPGMMDAANDATATLATGPLKCLWRLLWDESWLADLNRLH